MFKLRCLRFFFDPQSVCYNNLSNGQKLKLFTSNITKIRDRDSVQVKINDLIIGWSEKKPMVKKTCFTSSKEN